MLLRATPSAPLSVTLRSTTVIDYRAPHVATWQEETAPSRDCHSHTGAVPALVSHQKDSMYV